MPIEIKELQIKINVTESSANDATSQGGGSGSGSHATNDSVADKEAFLQECVEKVLEIIKNKVER
jgi:Family of unknown function (DUF5908)